MRIDSIIKNPVTIRIGKSYNYLIINDDTNDVLPLTPGVVLNGEHFGFILIVDTNDKQLEMVYQTQCKISAIGMAHGILSIYEDGKKNIWKFHNNGKLISSAVDSFSNDFINEFLKLSEYKISLDGPVLENPIRIKIDPSGENSMILYNNESLPVSPGCMFGGENYGFILVYDTDNGEKEIYYPTENIIDAVGSKKEYQSEIEIYEKGKYYPWKFTYDGKLLQQAVYNEYSRRDVNFIKKLYQFNDGEAEEFIRSYKK